jgi:hypothetical protein
MPSPSEITDRVCSETTPKEARRFPTSYKS